MSVYSDAKAKAAEAVATACRKAGITATPGEISSSIEDARAGFGDIACTLAFSLAKKEKKNPKELAEKLASSLPETSLFSEIKTVGPYINFHFSPEFHSSVLGQIADRQNSYGSGEAKQEKVLVEFPSVNPNKPWHVGHLRNALLGDSVARVLEFQGHPVERIDYIDDLGLQVATSIWSYVSINSNIEGKADQWIGKQYVDASKKAEEKQSEVRAIVKGLEEGEGETAKLGRELCEKCVKAQYQTAYSLNIYHDALIWESDIVKSKLLETALSVMLKSGAVTKETEGENKGCIVAKLGDIEEFKDLQNPDKVLVRSDGTATYTAKDIAFHLWKFGIIESPFTYSLFEKQPNNTELYTTSHSGKHMPFGSASILVNLIGVEQKYPQKVLNTIISKMGYEKEAANHIHLAYEHAWLPDAKFSGRQGTWLGYSADDVISEAEKRAYEEIRERFKDMGEDEKKAIAKSVGHGAVRFSFIRTTPEKKLVFKWDEALNFDGDSAPYIQYSHARCSRILEKAGDFGKPDYSQLKEPEEKDLVKLLSKFPLIVEKSAREYRPHHIAEYALEVAGHFSKFYTAHPVLKAEPGLREARLSLVQATKTVLKNALSLLGIEAPERM